MSFATSVTNLPQLLLLPGFLCDEDLWRDQITGLANQARCRVADFSQGKTIAELASQLLDEAAPQFALAGFSFGGYVAQEVLRQAPERVIRLALIGTSQKSDTPERAALRIKTSDAIKRTTVYNGMGRRSLPTFLHPDHLGNKDLIDRMQAMNQRLGKRVFLQQNAMGRQDGSQVLGQVRCPTLVACGDSDQVTRPANVEQLAALIPNARFQLIKKSGHMAPMEQPEAVTAALADWLTW